MNLNNKKNVSNRECEVLLWLSNGLTAKEIALELNISPRTVEHHIKNVKEKTNLYRRSQLIRFYKTRTF